MHSLGMALVWASLAGIVLDILTGMRFIGKPAMVAVILTGSAGWMLQQEWLIGSTGVIVSVVLAASGVSAKRRRGRS